jgi:hypothetical protein
VTWYSPNFEKKGPTPSIRQEWEIRLLIVTIVVIRAK